MLVESL